MSEKLNVQTLIPSCALLIENSSRLICPILPNVYITALYIRFLFSNFRRFLGNSSLLFFKRFTNFVPSVQLFITAGKTVKKVSSTV